MATKKKAKKTKKKAAAARKPRKVLKKAKAVPKAAAKKKAGMRRTKGRAEAGELVGYQRKGLGAFSGGQSGDLQGLKGRTSAGSEGVEELLEEGNTFEAEAVAGVENAADPDVSEVVTHEYPEDDVPEEYRDKD